MNAISENLKFVEIVSKWNHSNLTVQLLGLSQSKNINIISMKDAMESRALEVSEIGDGKVEEINFANRGDIPVYLGEGNIVHGMKQSRSIILSLILPAHASRKVKTLCVEETRWRYENGTSGTAYNNILYSSLRAQHNRSISQSLSCSAGYDARGMQSRTWAGIENRLRRNKSNSKTRFVGDYYHSIREKVLEYTSAFSVSDKVCGMLSYIDDKPIELSLMATPALFSSQVEGLIHSIVVEAVSKEFKESLATKREMTYRQFMDAIKCAKTETYPSMGVGEDIRFENKENGVHGSCLVLEGNLVSMGAYAL